MQIIRKQRKLVTVRRAARLRSAKLIIARLGRGHHGWGGILSGSAQVVLRNPGQPPAQPSPAHPSPGRTFPTFLGRNVVWRVAGPGQPGTGHHHHHTSHCLTQTHTVSSQGDGTCSHPPQRIKQFSFVRRFLGPVDMLIITLDTNFSLGWIQCSALL